MASVVSLVSSPKISGRFYYLFVAVRNGICAPGPGRSWKRESSSYNEQKSNQADMPVPMENPYKEPPKKCVLCGVTVDYKNIQLLSQFISPYTGHIFGHHITGLCKKKQNEMAKAIKRAHCMGFMSVMHKDPVFRNDPKICNIKYPE
ncbi:28S ribosomal protein S18c, mitochondrial [Pseudonaja textilis]|uniref:28S ribosomal protein S18c, mitochondrial n=1 Tax=Pseudonaja textilis TaxID=8673 RepID=UPI000EA889F3|nr:28S ribosomal protein S18c, mitochondrial [Pseudonaja textilis]